MTRSQPRQVNAQPSQPYTVKGWCPGAWRPMATGDGWLVRVRPRFAEFSRAQVLALCDAAERFGNGLLELTSRANLQLRGVTQASWPELMDFLVAHQLVETTPERERLPACMLAPDWQSGDLTHRIARLLDAQADQLAVMPGKVGIAIDAGATPRLSDTPADFRVEQSLDGQLLVRAEGYAAGTRVDSVEAAVSQLAALSHWFMASGGQAAGRMARHQAPLPGWAPLDAIPAPAAAALAFGPQPLAGGAHDGKRQGDGKRRGDGENNPEVWCYGWPLGRAHAAVLRQAVAPAGVRHVRITPWRRWLVVGGSGDIAGLISHPDDPRLAMDACPGAPYCAQASVATQPLAEALSERGVTGVHISGCAKGCARRRPAKVCLIGRAGQFDVVLNGCADDAPVASGLNNADVLGYLADVLD